MIFSVFVESFYGLKEIFYFSVIEKKVKYCFEKKIKT